MSYVQPSTVTLKELSNLSGFSVSTVSKALNNKLDISIETRKAIKDIAKKHHYVPNNFAVALRVKRTQTVAVSNTSVFFFILSDLGLLIL